MRRFFLKRNDGLPASKDDSFTGNALISTRKQWIAFIFDKIVNIPDSALGTDRVSLFLKSARDGLRKLSPGVDPNTGNYINPFVLDHTLHPDPDLQTDRDACIHFSEAPAIPGSMLSELYCGVEALKIIKDLIGHFTIVYVFWHGIKYYRGPSGFKVDFQTIEPFGESSRFAGQYDIYPSSFALKMSAARPPHFPEGKRKTIGRHMLMLFCGDSFTFLPVKGKTRLDSSKVNFGYSPLSFLTSSLSASSPLVLNKKINEAFKNGYNLFTSRISILDDFHSSCDSMVKVFDKILDLELKNRWKSKIQRDTALFQLHLLARFGSYHPKVSVPYKGVKYLYARSQAERLLLSSDFNRPLIFSNYFENFDAKRNPVRSVFTTAANLMNKDRFYGSSCSIYRELSIQDYRLTVKNIYQSDSFQAKYDEIIDIKAGILRKLFKENGDAVSVFPSINFGVNFGFQYIKTAPKAEQVKNIWLRKRFPFFPQVPDQIIKIDLNEKVDGRELYDEKIKFLASLSLLYYRFYGQVPTTFNFDIKPFGAKASSPNIAIFNGFRIYRTGVVHSRLGAPAQTFTPVLIGPVGNPGNLGETGIYPLTDDDEKSWKDSSYFFPLDVIGLIYYHDKVVLNNAEDPRITNFYNNIYNKYFSGYY